jgi:hypothetical protein
MLSLYLSLEHNEPCCFIGRFWPTGEKMTPTGDILLSTGEKSTPTGEIIPLANFPSIFVA